MTGLEAVLFDMDGLLVDSEPEWFEVESEVYARLGGKGAWSQEHARSLVGNALEVSAAEMVALAGAQEAADVVAGWFVDGMAQRLRRGVAFKPGGVLLLSELAEAGVAVGLVSSSYRRLVDIVVAQLPPGSVRASVAGDEVARGKPHPEGYLTALQVLGARAAATVVLEDSSTGATAGAAAGCVVVVVPDVAPIPRQHPWHEVPSLRALDVAALRALLGGDGR